MGTLLGFSKTGTNSLIAKINPNTRVRIFFNKQNESNIMMPASTDRAAGAISDRRIC